MTTQYIIGLTPHERELWDLLQPTVEDTGLELVRLKLLQRGSPVLEIMVERQDVSQGSVNLDECAEVSRRMSRILDVDDPMPDEYRLEVSSPGVERPLTTVAALEAHVGRQVKVQLSQPYDGARKLKGFLENVSEQAIELKTDKEVVTLDLLNVQDVTLKLTDEEMAVVMKNAKQRN